MQWRRSSPGHGKKWNRADVRTNVESTVTNLQKGPGGLEPRASEKFRAFLDGKEAADGEITITAGPRDGMLCTLDGKVVSILAVMYNEASDEIDEIYLEEVRE